MSKITKSQILKLIRPYTTRKDILNAIFREINAALVRNDKVLICSFGKFEVYKSKVRYGQDFKTNKRIRLKPVYKIRFRASKLIERIVNERTLIEE